MENYLDFVNRLTKPLGLRMDLIHAALGVASESGEVADQIKSAMVYGRELDLINLVEELGDNRFFGSIILNKFGLTWDDIDRANMAKLNVRYQDGYSDAAANGREKEFERQAIEQAVWGGDGAPKVEFE